VRIFGFIAAKKVELSISIMCRVLSVSRSGFDAWHEREPCARALEDERLTSRIREIHGCNRGVYGSAMPSCRSSTASGSGASASQRLMRAAGLSGCRPSAGGERRSAFRASGCARTLSIGPSRPKDPLGSGSPTSPTSEAGRAGSRWPLSRMCSRGGSSAGAWPITCAPSSLSTPCRWRSGGAARARADPPFRSGQSARTQGVVATPSYR
jgi:hypothetical protein